MQIVGFFVEIIDQIPSKKEYMGIKMIVFFNRVRKYTSIIKITQMKIG